MMRSSKTNVYASFISLLLAICSSLLAVGCNQPSLQVNSIAKQTEHAGAVPASHKASLTSLQDVQKAARQANVRITLPQWETTPEAMRLSATEAMAEGDKALHEIVTIPREKQTFANTIAALDAAYYPVSLAFLRVNLIEETHQDKVMRDTATEVSKELRKWVVDASFRRDVYLAVKTYATTETAVTGEDAMLLKKILRDYRRNGMTLHEKQRAELQQLKIELNDLGSEFAKNINNANTLLEFTPEELAGLPEDFLNNAKLKTDKGTYRINANVRWQAMAVYENASNEETRKRLKIARSSRALEENRPIFSRILKIRARIAKILGFDHWADYRIEIKMAKNAATALAFEHALAERLTPKYEAELETYRRMKAKETGDPDATIHYWDLRYYRNQLKKEKYAIDDQALKVFFELDRTLEGMFGIFEEVFQLNIRQVEAPYKWVEDLRLYAVSDAESGAPLGLIYMDLFPREGKYGHFAQFSIIPGRLNPDGSRQGPVGALICNFPPAADGKPSLLTYEQVETLFHEFGHALHNVLTQTKYAAFTGTSVPQDFVEVPSQIMENWVRDKTTLDRFAADYRDPSVKLPKEILAKMEQARLATIATHYRRQLAFGILDLEIHTTTDQQVFDKVVDITNRIMGEIYYPVPDGTGFVASFGHLGGGYDAGYYGYAWADAISVDMASLFYASPKGLMDPEIGCRLRDQVFAVGGSREIDDSIRAFLGRERSLEPFLKHVGLELD